MGKKSRKRKHNTRKIDSPSKSQSSRLCFSEHWHCSIIARSGISGEVLIYLHALATLAYGIKVKKACAGEEKPTQLNSGKLNFPAGR